MPESETEYIDYYPPGWTEEIQGKNSIEWIYDEDQEIFVRLDGTMGDGNYSVIPITGINTDGEEFVTRPLSGLSRKEAFEAAGTLVYAINGTIGRINGEPQFCGDSTQS